jgi:transcriptional regulator with XRE-family HTH domain
MDTVKAHTKTPQTNLRNLRKILTEAMASASTPPICARIRETRERLLDQAKAEGGREAAAEFSQEAVARRVGVSLGAYRAYEFSREPDYERRQQIARALGFSEDYFEVSDGETKLLREALEQLADVRASVARIEAALGASPPKRRARTSGS